MTLQALRTVQQGPEMQTDSTFSFGLSDFPRLLRAMVWPFILTALVALLASYFYLRNAEHTFAIISEIVVERKQLAAGNDESGESVRFNATQGEILKSHRILKAAIDETPLPADQHAKAQEGNLSDEMWVAENLIVSPITGTQVIAISYSTTDAPHGVRLLSSVVDQYLLLARGNDMEVQEETLGLLNKSATELRTKLAKLEENYRELRKVEGSLGEGAEALSLYKQVAEDYNSQRIRAEREVPLLVARLAEIRRAKTTDAILSLPEKLNQGSTGRAIASSNVEIGKMLTRFTEGHPDLVAARQNLADLEQRLRIEASDLEKLVSNRLQDARRESARLEAAYNKAVASAKATDVQRVAQDSMRGEIESTKVLLAEATSRINDRSIAIGSLAGGRSGTVAEVIRPPAIPPEASWPRPSLVYALALFFAGAIALLIGLIRIARQGNQPIAANGTVAYSPSASELMRESARRRVLN